MTPLYGWAPMGKRVIDKVPHGHWKTTTFIAALRHDGLTAPMVIDGAINGELWKNLGDLCDIFTSKECYLYYKNAEYRNIKNSTRT